MSWNRPGSRAVVASSWDVNRLHCLHFHASTQERVITLATALHNIMQVQILSQSCIISRPVISITFQGSHPPSFSCRPRNIYFYKSTPWFWKANWNTLCLWTTPSCTWKEDITKLPKQVSDYAFKLWLGLHGCCFL